MTDDPDTELRNLIEDINEIEKVTAEVKAARAEGRELSREVRAILNRWERDLPTADELDQWLDEQDQDPGPRHRGETQ
jgi:hypothetical protein